MIPKPFHGTVQSGHAQIICKIAKENWLEEQRHEIDNLEKQHLTRQMHENIRRVTNRRKTTQRTGIMDRHGNMCFEKETLVNVLIG